MSFFRQFPVIEYNTKRDGILQDTTDIFRYVDVNDALVDDVSSYTYYEILDGERPDIVSARLYGTPDYYWTFFVANDSLKEGLNSWPLSNRQFNEWMSKTYDEYSVLIFVPDYFKNTNKEVTYSNYFGGLDLTNVVITTTGTEGPTAEIKAFDIQTLQMWVHNISNETLLSQSGFKLCYKDNPYDETEQPDEYADFEDKRQKWYEDIFNWCGDNHQIEYNAFLNNTDYVDDDYESFYDVYFRSIIFSAQHVYADSQNAPKFTLDTDGEIVSAFTAYDDAFDSRILQIVPYYRGSLDENGHPSPTYTSGGVTDNDDQYQDTYTIGSYELFDKLSSTISYLEYEQEKNFEKRKIRVIRKSLINEFAERYQELINS